MAIIGIDLGTTNSLVSVYKDEESILIPNSFGDYLTPSVVSIDEEGKIVVGKLAKERLITHPNTTAACFKRYMGTDKKFKLGEKLFSAEELSSFVLRKLIEDAKEFLQEEIEEVVISVPAYFSDDQRWATKTSGALAGVYVERIINEPSAAALTLHQSYIEDRTYAVIDFGGGTLDVSIVDAFDNIIEVVSVSGDNQLGGEDFNQEIMKAFLKHHGLGVEDITLNEKELLYNQVEKAKRELNTNKEITIKSIIKGKEEEFTITYEDFFFLLRPLLERIDPAVHRALRDAKEKIEDIDDVVLVGGSCKMKVVKEYLELLFKKEVTIEANPDYAIALGCGIVAGIKSRQEGAKDMLLTDICPFSLGIEIEGGFFSVIIERNSILPCSKEELYVPSKLGNTSINAKIYQGENAKVKNNIFLDKFKIEIPKNKEEYEEVSIRFTYDINGILEVEANVLSNNKAFKKLILNKKNRMDQTQLQKRLSELEKYKTHPREEENNKYIMERANRIYMELLGMKRTLLLEEIKLFEEDLHSQEPRIIKKGYDRFKSYLDGIEGIEREIYS